MMKKLFTTLAIVLVVAIIASAQEEGQTDTVKMNPEKLLGMAFEDLMDVRVITPTLSLQKSKQAPATVIVVTMDQIKMRGYRNLAEILNDLPGFTVQDRSDPQFYNAISIRGIFRQDYFVILLDGVRISSPTNEPLPVLENYPIYLAKQIEIVYGPGSALYGADAMAGVINIITQKESDKKLSITAMGGTQGYTNTNMLFNKKLKNDFNISFGWQYSYDAQPDFSEIYKDKFSMTSHETGVFNTVYGPMTPSQPVDPKYEAPIRAYNVFSMIDKAGFALRILHHYIEVSSSTTLKPDNGVYNKDVFYGQGLTMGSASYTTSFGKLQSVSTLVGSFYKVNPQSNFRNLYGGMAHGYKYSTGSMMKAEEQISYQLSKKIGLTGGFTYELFQSVPKTPELKSPVNTKGALSGVLLNSDAPNNPGGIESKFYSLLYSNIGSYFQVQYAPLDKISFTTGVRFDKNSRFGSTVNPRIGGVFNPFKNTTIKTLFGTAFWAPSPMVSFETYGSFYTVDSGTTYQSAFWHLPNPGLKPMKSQTFELSINQKIKKKLDLTFTIYKSNVDNLITNVSDNGNTNLYGNKFLGWNIDYIEVPYNQGSQSNYGMDLMANSTFTAGIAKLNIWSSVSFIEGRLLEHESASDKEIEQSTITPWQFRAGMDCKLHAFQFSVRLLQSGRQRMAGFNDDGQSRKTISGYSLLNLSANYSFNKKATLFINGHNVLDQRYRNLVSWDASSPNAPSFNGSLQNPLRVTTGVRIGL
jgi:outer membrane receptor for ferrienterochelin and colicin